MALFRKKKQNNTNMSVATPQDLALARGAGTTNTAYNRMFGGATSPLLSGNTEFGANMSVYKPVKQSTRQTKEQVGNRLFGTQSSPMLGSMYTPGSARVSPQAPAQTTTEPRYPGGPRPEEIGVDEYSQGGANYGIDYGMGGGDYNLDLGSQMYNYDPMTGGMMGGIYGNAINDGLQFAQQSLSTGSENILGRDVNNINDLYALRSDLFKAQSMAQGGDDDTIKKLVSEISGIPENYMSPELGQAIRNNGANMFTGTLNYVDGLIAKEMDLVGKMMDYNMDNQLEAPVTLENYQISPQMEQMFSAYGVDPSVVKSDPYMASLLLSQGKKDLTSTQGTRISELYNVTSRIAGLADEVKKGDTGPVKGVFKKVNPYNVNARTFMAQLTSALPGVARGVFGEVGVLTDTDMARYAQVLPSLTQPNDVNKALTLLALSGLKNTIQTELGVMSGTYDVSTQVPKLAQIMGQINSLEQDLGIQPAQTQQSQDPYIQELYQMGYTDDDLRRAGIGSFKQSSSISSLDELKQKIAGVESGGNYRALGPVIKNPKSGYYKQRAMGKYQVMPGNLTGYTGKPGGWDMMVFGQPITPAQFMNNPQIQEQMASAILGMYVKQYGNYQDAISAWHSGRPLKQALASGARDVNMSTGQYVNNVLNYA